MAPGATRQGYLYVLFTDRHNFFGDSRPRTEVRIPEQQNLILRNPLKLAVPKLSLLILLKACAAVSVDKKTNSTIWDDNNACHITQNSANIRWNQIAIVFRLVTYFVTGSENRRPLQ